ncbi:hypothetical protein [Bacillus atrophaeus]|uniref:hypothetical protein n=1 Tax=Bacillus atrophaeus TaxID=1452 RepID=UPI000779C965|nr:hypothetical protein [Bacillus atrophaeus]KYD06605.1 hypothetical protein B4144_0570 [Bacillus atrophaeus]
MNKDQVRAFLTEVYQEIIVNLHVEKIPHYFSDQYIQVTDRKKTDINEFRDHIITLKEIVRSIELSPFYDFLFDQDKQTAVLRYTVTVTKKDGAVGEVEVIAIFELNDFKIVRCNELSCPLHHNDQFKDIARINKMNS